mgnify:FL=1|jgi:hypothetical protein|tara:strand:+ start:2578 stop:3000 length:423 start_codon:yes stop_codon:yes gene_type:complete
MYKNINYNSQFICTYRQYDELEYQNLCYQIQLLQAFNMMKYDEYILQQNVESIYQRLRENKNIKNILTILSKKDKNIELLKYIPSEVKHLFIFQLLFSFEYFDLFHKCFSKYILYYMKNVDISLENNNFFKEFEEYILNN